MRDVERLREALQYVPPHDRNTWLRMGMAIKSEVGETGFDIWDAWSQEADSYNARDARDVWKSIRPRGKVTAGTLFHEAKANGWNDRCDYVRPSAEALAERRRSAEESAAHDEAELQRERAATAAKAAAILKAATEVRAEHPYLERKRVAPVATLREIDATAAAAILGYAPQSGGEPLTGRLLAVPVKRGDSLATLELIDGNGRKAALAGRGSKAGGFWSTERLPRGDGAGCTLLIGEGVATALSASRASGHPAIAALSCGNLPAVAQAMRSRYPRAELVILADLGNGQAKAEQAARAVRAALALPEFPPDAAGKPTDFNDMACTVGANAVARVIRAAVAPAAVATGTDVLTCKYGGGRFELGVRGVSFVGTDKEGNEKAPLWICGRLEVIAKTRDANGRAWGRLLEWRDDDGARHQWAMPLELLEGDGADVRRELASRGLHVSPTKAARELLAAYLKVWPVEDRARCVAALGWHGSAYALPDSALGADGERVVFQNAHAIEPAFAQRGTAEGWRDSVAALAAGNSRIVFAIAAALAGPLAHLASEDSGGFHLRGASSSGKSTALKVAASVWGDPAAYVRLWRATANGLEGLAALHNDGLLILDELGQVDPREAGEAAYLLANGQGKARASRAGTARASQRWRLLYLSAGEVSLAAFMATVGKRANAGQEIRQADIEADAGAGLGCFEVLHGRATPAALSHEIKDAAAREFGAVGRVWLECVVQDRLQLMEMLPGAVREFVAESIPEGAAGQVERVARRFALVAAAGEVATSYRLTGWSEGESERAARACFQSWLAGFGGAGRREDRALFAQVRAFFEAHGSSRFEDAGAADERRVINRAGFYRDGPGDLREFLVLPETFKREVCQGFEPKTAARVLRDAGWIQGDTAGKTARLETLPGVGRTRVYAFTPKVWEAEA